MNGSPTSERKNTRPAKRRVCVWTPIEEGSPVYTPSCPVVKSGNWTMAVSFIRFATGVVDASRLEM